MKTMKAREKEGEREAKDKKRNGAKAKMSGNWLWPLVPGPAKATVLGPRSAIKENSAACSVGIGDSSLGGTLECKGVKSACMQISIKTVLCQFKFLFLLHCSA